MTERVLHVGDEVGAYRVTGFLGSGGMGEVYRARDARLGRDVAIKVLPQSFLPAAERLARFEREARMLASLNHQNIGAIYGVEDAGGVRALVLELIDGDTLADRLAGGPLAVTEALRVAYQIADALDAAHEKGIIHRDLKPANIKLTPQGLVKVLDFGLAKAVADEGPALPHTAEVTAIGTREGVVLGTAAYMSPEQARGRPVDKRADIWAFGCVLYEMLTGHRAFGRETSSDTLVAILEHQPDWRRLPAQTPPDVRRLLERCFDKDPLARLRDIADARSELRAAAAPGDPRARRRPPAGGRLTLVGGPMLAVLIAAGGYAGWQRLANTGQRPPALRPRFVQLTTQPGVEWFPSLSPDGKWIVYGGDGEGNRDIYLQGVGSQTPINLTADSRADDDQPAFSSDGERIAFRSERDGGGIFVMGRTGEAVRRITRTGFRPAWSPDGKHLAFTTENIDINPQNGRGPSALWVADVSSGEQRSLNVPGAVLASWSPHGMRIAYTVRSLAGGAGSEQIWTIPATGGTPVLVVSRFAADWNPAWSPDGKHLYFSSDRNGSMNLWRIPIDEESGRAAGDPEPIATPAPFAAHAAVSADGRQVAYSSVLITTNIQRLAMNAAGDAASGESEWVTTGSRLWSSPDPSPDGQWVTFYSRIQPEGDVYVARRDGTGLRQLTSDAALDRVPRWSQDGKWIAFFSNRGGRIYDLWKIRPDGSELQQVTEGGGVYAAWSPDGSKIATIRLPEAGKTAAPAYIFDANRPWKDQTPQMLPPFEPPDGSFVANSWSPDGERLAGQAGLDGKGVITYSLRSGRYERLTDVGEWPVWLPDNRHLLFVAGGKDFLVVDAQTKAVRKLYSAPRDVLGPPRLTPDGRNAFFSRRVTEADVWLVTLDVP